MLQKTKTAPVSHTVDYRPDIDGLRAVAVFSVVFYHYGARWLPGGFTGVDVFFVISGYIITFHSLNRMELGTFSIFDFYLRRIKRIMPPMILMVLAVLIFGWFYLMPSEYTELAKSASYAVLGLGNIYFYRNTGYFDQAAENQPLLHTWSLGVEEQFYLLWPLLLWVGLPLVASRRSFRVALAAAVLFAFAYAVWRTNTSSKAAFYLPHPRAWELGLGALVAFMPRIESYRLGEVLSVAGLALVGWSILALSPSDTFPGINAAYACVGSALLIWPKEYNTLTGQLLSIAPLQKAGLISYGVYLWHWPLIVFYRHLALEQPGLAPAVALFLVVVAISYLSYRFIERPIIRSRRRVARSISASACAVFGAGLMIYHSEGVPARLTAQVLAYASGADDYNQRRPECHRTDEFNPPLYKSCIYGHGNSPPAFAIWSDSHGVEIGEALGERLATRGQSLLSLTYSSCPPSLNFRAPLQKGCEAFTAKVIGFLAQNSDIQTVFLAAYYEFYLTSGADHEFNKGFSAAVSALAATGKKIIIIASNPELPGVSIPQGAARLAMVGMADTLAVTVEEHRARSSAARNLLDHLAATYENVSIFDPADILCRDGRCALVADGRPLLFDDNHLSRTGAAMLVKAMDAYWERPLTANGKGK